MNIMQRLTAPQLLILNITEKNTLRNELTLPYLKVMIYPLLIDSIICECL